MNKFIDFLKKDAGSCTAENPKISTNQIDEISNSRSLNTSRSKTIATVSGCLHTGINANTISISPSDANKFSEQVTELAYSEEFLNEFSNEIGSPKEGESEDDFVKRAKNKMANLLRAKLGK